MHLLCAVCSEGLDFSPMTREDVVAHVHELLAAALYQHTFLFYSRHLDTLLLASLYGYCKVNRLHKVGVAVSTVDACTLTIVREAAAFCSWAMRPLG